MATSLLALSDELLLEIVKCIGTDWRSLWALTLTCQRISPVARNALYRDVQLQIPQNQGILDARRSHSLDSTSSSFGWPELDSLRRTWSSHPDLLLQTLHTLAIKPLLTNLILVDSLLMEVAANAESLTSLKIEECDIHSIEILIRAFNEPAGNRFPKLQNLDIRTNHRHIATPCAKLICTHPSLQNVHIGVSILSQSRFGRPVALRTTNSMKKLVISHKHFHSDTLNKILPSTPYLEVLEIGIPDDHIVFDQNFQDRRYAISRALARRMPLILRPRELGGNLLPVRRTLRCLKIMSPRAVVASHDGSRIDLSTFESLEDLQISSALVFGNVLCMRKSSNTDITNWLPLNLVNLTIYFDTIQGMFHSVEDNENACDDTIDIDWFVSRSWSRLWYQGPGNRSVVTKSLGWLQDLSNHCTKLATFNMEEVHDNSLVRRQLRRGLTRMADELLSINVVPYHAEFFANFQFTCRIIVHVHRFWWRDSGSMTRFVTSDSNSSLGMIRVDLR